MLAVFPQLMAKGGNFSSAPVSRPNETHQIINTSTHKPMKVEGGLGKEEQWCVCGGGGEYDQNTL